MKFLVLWQFELAGLRAEVIPAISRMPQYADRLFKDRTLVSRYHIVGRHGGAWIYDVDSNEELERLLGLRATCEGDLLDTSQRAFEAPVGSGAPEGRLLTPPYRPQSAHRWRRRPEPL